MEETVVVKGEMVNLLPDVKINEDTNWRIQRKIGKVSPSLDFICSGQSTAPVLIE